FFGFWLFDRCISHKLDERCLAAAVNGTLECTDGIVFSADLRPVCHFTRVDLSDFFTAQAVHWISCVDEKDECFAPDWCHLQFKPQLLRLFQVACRRPSHKNDI